MSLDLQNFFTDKHNVCKLTKYIFYEKVNTQTSSHSEPQKALTLFNKAQWQGRDIYTSDQEAHRKMLYIYIIYVIYIYIYIAVAVGKGAMIVCIFCSTQYSMLLNVYV